MPKPRSNRTPNAKGPGRAFRSRAFLSRAGLVIAGLVVPGTGCGPQVSCVHPNGYCSHGATCSEFERESTQSCSARGFPERCPQGLGPDLSLPDGEPCGPVR